MKNDILFSSPLFQMIKQNEILSLLEQLDVVYKHYQKDEVIFYAGDIVTTIGLVLSGSLHLIKDDFWGHQTLIEQIDEGDIFAESFACGNQLPLSVNVIAQSSCTILFIDIQHLFVTKTQKSTLQLQLLHNILHILAVKNIKLMQKMEYITQRSTREKLLSYFSNCAQMQHSNTITIPFNRQQLADYLAIERSAMCKELSKLQKEKILTYHKQTIILQKHETGNILFVYQKMVKNTNKH